MRTSDQIDQLAAALASAQGQFETPRRTRTVTVRHKDGGQHQFSYAPLDEICRAVKPALKEHGIAFVQALGYGDNESWGLVTRIIHSSGQWIEGDLPIQPPKDWQGLGSAITYARRYMLTSLLGVVADEDDDGKGGTDNPPGHTTQQHSGSRDHQSPPCPECGNDEAIITDKYSGMQWHCWKRKGGCGASFNETDTSAKDETKTHSVTATVTNVEYNEEHKVWLVSASNGENYVTMKNKLGSTLAPGMKYNMTVKPRGQGKAANIVDAAETEDNPDPLQQEQEADEAATPGPEEDIF